MLKSLRNEWDDEDHDRDPNLDQDSSESEDLPKRSKGNKGKRKQKVSLKAPTRPAAPLQNAHKAETLQKKATPRSQGNSSKRGMNIEAGRLANSIISEVCLRIFSPGLYS